MGALAWVGVVVLAALAAPVVAYVSVKLGTYAFFRGKQLFEEDQVDGDK